MLTPLGWISYIRAAARKSVISKLKLVISTSK